MLSTIKQYLIDRRCISHASLNPDVLKIDTITGASIHITIKGTTLTINAPRSHIIIDLADPTALEQLVSHLHKFYVYIV